MGETCEICGREIATKATDPSSWCWRRLLENDHDVSADYECYKTGFEHLRSLYREWQDTVDRANDKAERAEADKEHAQMRWREAGRAPVPEGLLKRAAEELHCGRRGIPLGRNSWELLNEIEFYLGAREEDRRVRSTSEQPAAGPPSTALAQPPAPQEGRAASIRAEAALFLKRRLRWHTAGDEDLADTDAECNAIYDAGKVSVEVVLRTAIGALEFDANPLPAEPSAPQAVAAPQVTQEQLSGQGIEFNVNDCVWVRLTDVGRAVFADHWRPFCEPATMLKERAGWAKFQLWELARIFGGSLGNGSPVPFETTIRLEAPPFGPEHPAPPAPVSAPQDNENQLSGKGKA